MAHAGAFQPNGGPLIIFENNTLAGVPQFGQQNYASAINGDFARVNVCVGNPCNLVHELFA